MTANYSTSQTWQEINDKLEVCKLAISDSKLPFEIAPQLTLKVIANIQTCILKWEQVEKRIYVSLSKDSRWAFDDVGNNLRASLIEYQKGGLTSKSRPTIYQHIHNAYQTALQIPKELFWDASLSISLYSSPTSLSHNVGKGGQKMKMNKYEAAAAFKTLEVHRANAADLRIVLAKDPDNIHARRQLETENDEIENGKKELRENGYDVENRVFEEPVKNTNVFFASKTNSTPSNIKPKSSNRTKQNKSSKPSHSDDKRKKPEATTDTTDDISSIRKSFADYLAIFQEGIILDGNKKLKQAIEIRFSVLLLRINNLIRETQDNGDDAGYFYDVSNLIYMSTDRLRESGTHDAIVDISNYLSSAINIFDVAINGD